MWKKKRWVHSQCCNEHSIARVYTVVKTNKMVELTLFSQKIVATAGKPVYGQQAKMLLSLYS